MADSPQEWPNRGAELLGISTFLCVLSTGFLVWRVVYGLRNDRKLLLCDYLLIIATLMNITATGIRYKSTIHGQGRHILDPSIKKPHDILEYSYYLWIGQVLNLMAVAILKYSICAYLLALRFSKVYAVIVWASILMVTALNLLCPAFGLFSCTPFDANWNRAIKGRCWFKGGMGLTYAQGISNIITDIVYVVAPVLYLNTVQLSRRTKWGIRSVFCLGLVATVCSIFKTIEMSALKKTRDPTWDGVNLTIWSSTELSVGILIASLPPLRKQFDKMFSHIVPSTFLSKSKTPGSGGIPMYNISRSNTKPMGRSGIHDDADSEQDILPGSLGSDGGITKTVVHEVTSVERGGLHQSSEKTHGQYGEIGRGI
ncbi:hypothetical protein BS50DRAFT_630818 [Corynespora cassiicola Philippines]|uniref:Rhodopsin domain-containing protein n=1 Tax=Corynespora cassiicola Philippines TaxID=1448308 RepID=A0A2T2NZB2_CORCC|nr:hypothetical protein BS50DRAFT_630818 [Corynespora cassiicola Philippines]